MPDHTLGSIVEALEDMGANIAAQNGSLAAQNERIAKQNELLKKFVPRSQWRTTIAAFVLILVLALYVGWRFRDGDHERARNDKIAADHRQEDQMAAAKASDAAILKNTCVLKGLLEQARTSSIRNPIPPGLDPETRAFVERSRADAVAIYEEQLAGLNITLDELGGVPCPVRTAPSTGGTP